MPSLLRRSRVVKWGPVAMAAAALCASAPAQAADAPPGTVTGPGNRCLDVAGAGSADGTSVQLFACNGTAAQRWRPAVDGTLRALGKCLDAGEYPGRLHIRACDGRREQRWMARDGALASAAVRGCVTAGSDGALSVATCDGRASQQFSFPVAESAVVGLAGKCMDVAGAQSGDGTAVQLYECNGTRAQAWSRPAGDTLRALGKCLDASGDANGARVQLWTCNGSAAQVWRVLADQTMVNARSGRCLDVTDRRTENGAKLQVWDCFAGANQRWAAPWSPADGVTSPAEWGGFTGTVRVDRLAVENGWLVGHGAVQGRLNGRHGEQLVDNAFNHRQHAPLVRVTAAVSATCDSITLHLDRIVAWGAPGGDAFAAEQGAAAFLYPGNSDAWTEERCRAVAKGVEDRVPPEALARLVNALI